MLVQSPRQIGACCNLDRADQLRMLTPTRRRRGGRESHQTQTAIALGLQSRSQIFVDASPQQGEQPTPPALSSVKAVRQQIG